MLYHTHHNATKASRGDGEGRSREGLGGYVNLTISVGQYFVLSVS